MPSTEASTGNQFAAADHRRLRPKSRFAQRLFHNHRMHHFRNEHYWYSFTVPQVDTMFGTNPDDQEVPRSPTCRTLEYGE